MSGRVKTFSKIGIYPNDVHRALECVHSALVMHMLWVYFIEDVNDVSAFAFTVWYATLLIAG